MTTNACCSATSAALSGEMKTESRLVVQFVNIALLNAVYGKPNYGMESRITCVLFHRRISEQVHPRPRKQFRDDAPVDGIVRTIDGVRSNSKYANENDQNDDPSPQLSDLERDSSYSGFNPLRWPSFV